MSRFFVDPENIINDKITIEGEDARHIGKVLRCKIGEEITVCDLCGNDYLCKISSIDNDTVTADIKEKKKSDTEPKTEITLFQGLPKSDKMELIIQKCVEIGVCSVVPVMMKRTVVKLDKKDKEEKKTARWQKIAQSAAKQSGRGIIPTVREVLSFKDALNEASHADAVLLAYEDENENGLKEFVSNFKGKTIAVFIGPEGGFEESEVEEAKALGAKIITLGKRILRTETAGMVASAILLYELG